MGKYVARRLSLMVVAAVGVTLISFVISHAVPADPIVSNLGQQASQRPEIVQAFNEKWGLDKPLHMQYLAFLANLTRTTPIEYLWVTLKTPPANATAGAGPNYRLHYPNIPGELQLDNARVVVQRFIIKPWQWEGLHPHPGNQLYVHVLGGKWAARYGDKETVSDSKTGSVGWYHAVTLSEQHQSGNAGDGPIDLIWVTLIG